MTTLPLFPLRSVLCPGVALPLHIFEERYRLMIGRCIERDEPFGVVLLREGSEVGPLSGAMAAVGTTAVIRRAGRYPDGRLDILTVGGQRFHLDAVDSSSEPYLVGLVTLLDEPVGQREEARHQAERVGRRFLEYLRLLRPNEGDGPEIELEFEIEVEAEGPGSGVEDSGTEGRRDRPAPAAATPDEPETEEAGADVAATDIARTGAAGAEQTVAPDAADPEGAPGDRGPSAPADGSLGTEGLSFPAGGLSFPAESLSFPAEEISDLDPEQRSELLMAAARRLLGTEDPTALSYVLTALVQVDLASRQSLLESPSTVERLVALDRLLAREAWLLRQGLRPIIIDPTSLTKRTH